MPRGSKLPNVAKPDIGNDEMKMYLSNVYGVRQLASTGTPKSKEEWKERCDQYFEFCIEHGMKPGVEGLATACGCTRWNLYQYEKGTYRHSKEIGEIITQAKQMIATLLEQWGCNGELNPVVMIWLQKNHFGYVDNHNLNVTDTVDNHAALHEISLEQLLESVPEE